MWEAEGEGLLQSWANLNYILQFCIIKQEQNKTNKNPQTNKKTKQKPAKPSVQSDYFSLLIGWLVVQTPTMVVLIHNRYGHSKK